MENDLIKLLSDNDINLKGTIDYCEIQSIDKTIVQIRDCLLDCATIDIEDLVNKYYIAHTKIGMNSSGIVVKLNDKSVEILTFAKEGIIKQHTAEKTMKMVRSALEYE